MRRLNRGLFQLALENEETRPDDQAALDAAAAEVPAEEVPAEAPARASNAQVTVQVETDGKANVVEGGRPAARAPAARPAARPAAAVAAEEEPPVEVAEEVVEPPVEEAPAEEVPAEVPAEEPPVEEAPAAAAPEVVEVQNAAGETVATVETGEGTTKVVTDAPAEITVVEGEGGAVEVSVDVDATGGAEAPAEAPAEEVEPAIAVEEMVIIEADGEAAEVEITEAVEVAEDTAELIEEVDDAEDAVVALEALNEVAALAAQNGGLDSNGARLLKISTEHIYQHMGLGRAVGIPAMESFNIPGARVSATSIACEEIGEQAKNIWKAIVDGIKRAAAWLAEFFQKIFTANGRIKASAERLLAATDKMNGTPNAKTVGDAKMVRSLSIGGKLPANLGAEVARVVAFFEESVSDRTAQALASVRDSITSAVSTDGDKAEEKVREAILSVVGKGLSHKFSGGMGVKSGVPEAPEGTSVSMSPTFLGEQVVWAYIPETVEAIGMFRSGIGVAPSKVGDDAKATVLQPRQIAEVAKAALKYVEASKSYEKIQKEVKSLSDKIAIELGRGSFGMSEGEGVKARAKSAINALKAARHLMKGIHQPAGAVAARSVNAALSLAAASAKAYGAKAEAPAAAAAA